MVWNNKNIFKNDNGSAIVPDQAQRPLRAGCYSQDVTKLTLQKL